MINPTLTDVIQTDAGVFSKTEFDAVHGRCAAASRAAGFTGDRLDQVLVMLLNEILKDIAKDREEAERRRAHLKVIK
jgi:hypothetical protein